MSTISAYAGQIVLITDDIDNVALIDDAISDLPDYVSAYPALTPLVGKRLKPWPSTSTAEARLSAASGAASPALIILDAMVRGEDLGNPGNGTEGVALLDWLADNKPQIPVVVLTATRVEGLELRLIGRDNIATLSITQDDFNADFAKVMASLAAPAGPSRRRITVEVGDYDARYYIMDGYHEQKNDSYSYTNAPQISDLIGKVELFSPWTEGILSGTWQDDIRTFGNEVFTSLIAGTIGPHILKRMKGQRENGDQSPVDVELRFDIQVKPDETAKLFGLPFELAKPPEDLDNYLCTRVPMARRIQFLDSGRAWMHGHNVTPVPHGRPLKLLFVNASFKGSVVLTHERTGRDYRYPNLNRLENTLDEWKAVQEFSTEDHGKLLEEPVLLGGGPNRVLGDKLVQQVERTLVGGDFDILHFAGHSITMKDNGGTFLIFPSKNGEGIGVSVREVAEWVREGGCRLVAFSSCSSSSLRTAIETMRSGAEGVIGFRWDVNDRACVDYFRRFYSAYLPGDRSICEAYCYACHKASISKRGLPIWASAVAVVRD